MKLLFLDMDGVVNKANDNCDPKRYPYKDKWCWRQLGCELTYVDPKLAETVSKLIFDYDLKIVSSSSWRLYYSMEQFKELLKARFLPGDNLIGYTPDLGYMMEPRREEIKCFLTEFQDPVEKYVILDDTEGADYTTKKGKFFRTDFRTGYTETVDRKVRKFLERKT